MALLDNREPVSKELTLTDGVLRTNGALVSMRVPEGWSAKLMASKNVPGLPPETLIMLIQGEGLKTSIGLYFSGMIDEEFEGKVRTDELFDQEIDLKAGTPEANKLIGGTGVMANETHLRYYIVAAGKHAVQSDEKYCRGIRSTEFNGLKSVIYEFQNDSTGTRTVEYCLDVLGNGQIIYFLYYRAPIETFSKSMDIAVDAFKTSKWRKDFDPAVPLDVVS